MVIFFLGLESRVAEVTTREWLPDPVQVGPFFAHFLCSLPIATEEHLRRPRPGSAGFDRGEHRIYSGRSGIVVDLND